jgi:alpha-1,2-mannosyltransferase
MRPSGGMCWHTREPLAFVVLLAWVVFAIIGIASAYTLRTWDFGVFATAAERFIAGAELYRGADRDMPFKYPPFAAPLLAPFGLGAKRVAAVSWNLGSMVALLWVLCVALPKWREEDETQSRFAFTPAGALWAGAILAHPLLFELRRGQADLLALAAVAAAVTLAQKRPWAAGALAVVAMGLKLPAALVVLYLMRFRRWRALLAMGAALLALELVVLLRYGLAGGIALHQSWWHVLAATTPDRVLSTQGWIPLVLLATGLAPAWGVLAVQAIATAVLVAVLHARQAGRDVWFASLTLAMAGLSPLCWNPNYLLAFPALTRTFNRARAAAYPRPRLVIVMGIVAAVVLAALTPGIVTPDRYQQILATYRPYAWLSLLLLLVTILDGPATAHRVLKPGTA